MRLEFRLQYRHKFRLRLRFKFRRRFKRSFILLRNGSEWWKIMMVVFFRHGPEGHGREEECNAFLKYTSYRAGPQMVDTCMIT